jgi:hypothetical protein
MTRPPSIPNATIGLDALIVERLPGDSKNDDPIASFEKQKITRSRSRFAHGRPLLDFGVADVLVTGYRRSALWCGARRGLVGR